MKRITEKDLAAVCARLNRITNSPETYMGADRKCNIGHYHISYAYGGACLHRICSTGGGVTTPLMGGHVPKRELWERMHAYIQGIESTKP